MCPTYASHWIVQKHLIAMIHIEQKWHENSLLLWLSTIPVSKALLSNLGGSSFFLTAPFGFISFVVGFTGIGGSTNFWGGGWN